MAVKKAPQVPQEQIDQFINDGSPAPKKQADKSTQKSSKQTEDISTEKEIKFVMSIPPELSDKIEEVRRRSRSSRRSWFLTAALEKLKNDGDL